MNSNYLIHFETSFRKTYFGQNEYRSTGFQFRLYDYDIDSQKMTEVIVPFIGRGKRIIFRQINIEQSKCYGE